MRKMLLVLALLVPLALHSQDYPTRPVRVLVGYPPGGGMDTIARVLAPKLGEALGQQFVIENRPGASGGVAAEALAGAQPDGHVLMLAESGTLALPSVNPKVTFDPLRQFAPVGGVCMLPKGAAAMMPDIISGQVPIGVISAIAAAGPTRAGRIRTLAVTSPQRLAAAPDWPAMAETLPGFSAAPNVFVVAPAGTPQRAISKLNGAIRGALGSREVEENFAKQGATATPSTPEELRAQIAEEVKRWAAVVKDAGIKLE